MTPAEAVAKPAAKKAKAKKQLAQIRSLNEGDVPTDAPANASVDAEAPANVDIDIDADADQSSEQNHVETTAAGGTITFPRSDKKGGKIPETTPKTGNSNETAPVPPEPNVVRKTITIKPDQFKTENQEKKTMNFQLDLGDGSFKEI